MNKERITELMDTKGRIWVVPNWEEEEEEFDRILEEKFG
jgi:hypothetical protein